MREKLYVDIIAYFLGDGTLERNSKKPYFSSKYLKLLLLYMFKIKTIFPETILSIRKYTKKSRRKHEQQHEYRLYVEETNTKLAHILLQHYNFLQAGTLDLRVLNPILNSTLHVSLFLKGFFDAEGGLYWKRGMD